MPSRILLIDSDKDFLAITKELLKKDGYQVMLMDEVTMRLVTLNVRRRIDCVVVDIDNPYFHFEGSKETFAETFKNFRCPIIIYSSCKKQNSLTMADEATSEKGFKVVKKSKPGELLYVIRKTIEMYKEDRLIGDEELDEMFAFK